MRPEQRPSGRRPPGGGAGQPGEHGWDPSRDQAPPTETLSPTEAIFGYVEGEQYGRGGQEAPPRRDGQGYRDPRHQEPQGQQETRYREGPYQETQWGAHPRWDGWEQQQRQQTRQDAPRPAGSPPSRRTRGGGGAPPSGPKRRRLTLVIAAVAAVLVLGGGAGAYLVFFRGDEEPPVAAPPATAPPEAPADQQPEPAEPDPNRASIGVKPTAENTGVPAGVELKPSEGLTITEDGKVVEGLDIDGCLTIEASDVTVRNTRIKGECEYSVRLGDDARNVVLEDIEVDGGGNTDGAGIVFGDYTLRRGYIHGLGEGLKLGDNTVVESSFIGDFATEEGGHNDGMQSSGGSNIVVRGNNVVLDAPQTAALFVTADLGEISDVLIEGNWFDGGGYTMYVGDGDEANATDVRVVNNKFGRGGQHGVLQLEGDGVEWQNNTFTDGEEITP